jgi:succinoglycan biosynthesis protein ExoO
MQPDVSFVIAAFNAQASLARAIRSALDQRDVTVEVVVVDDCSSDGTLDVARSFPGDAVRVVALEKNRGPGGARNAGLEAAEGRWIAVLDADDTVYPDRIGRMIRRGEKLETQIVVDNLEVVEETVDRHKTMFSTVLLESLCEIKLADFIAANLMFENTFSFGYMKPIFERRFLHQHGLRYDETLRIGEDYILFASALAKGGRCAVEPEVGYSYHVRTGSISRVLERGHVAVMLAADQVFVSAHQLDAAAAAAQVRRTRSLEEAAAFLALVQHLKDRAPLKAIGAALRDLSALRHLRMPIAARLRRVAKSFNARAFDQSAKRAGDTI